jgi:predicted metal-binding protein
MVSIKKEHPMPAFERHVFVCCNARPEGAPRPSCTCDGTSALHAELKKRANAAGLGSRVRINKSGCLDQCEHGPMVVSTLTRSGTAMCSHGMLRRLWRNTWSQAVPWSGCA